MQFIDIGALLSDDHSRPSSMNCDARLFGRPLDDDSTDSGLTQLVEQEFADVQILE